MRYFNNGNKRWLTQVKGMDVSSSALAASVQAVRALVSAYEGYEKGRFMKSDE